MADAPLNPVAARLVAGHGAVDDSDRPFYCGDHVARGDPRCFSSQAVSTAGTFDAFHEASAAELSEELGDVVCRYLLPLGDDLAQDWAICLM